MKSLAWTHQALGMGAQLTVSSVMIGKTIFRAKIAWPHGEEIRGDISTSVEGALENLESELQDDASSEPE